MRAHPADDQLERQMQQIAQWLTESDRVLIGAGAGLSAAAGIDYTDQVGFAERYPALVKRGLRAAYQMIGYSELPEAAFWGYWADHVNEVRFSDRRSTVYEELFELVRAKHWFVLTSNVDALFARNGFDPDNVCAIQGDFAFLQCLVPCTTSVWDSAPSVRALVGAIDPATQEVRDSALIPRCPHCGGTVFFNVRGGSWFVEEHLRGYFERLRAWVKESSAERLLVLDIGSGFNTPSVVRWPMERVADAFPTSRFVRINLHDAEIPGGLANRGTSVGMNARDAIRALFLAAAR